VIIYDYGDGIPQREGSKDGTSAWRLASQCTDLALGNSFDDFLQGVHQVLLVTLVTLFRLSSTSLSPHPFLDNFIYTFSFFLCRSHRLIKIDW
jgi:hypothetical protein